MVMVSELESGQNKSSFDLNMKTRQIRELVLSKGKGNGGLRRLSVDGIQPVVYAPLVYAQTLKMSSAVNNSKNRFQ